jgi:hypothetical protein
LGSAEGKPPVSLKFTEFSLKQFAQRMGQANYIALNRWNKVRVPGFPNTKHRFTIPGQNRLKHVLNVPLHRETAIGDCLETFEVWLQLDNLVNAEWIRRQWVEMVLKKYASEIWEAMKKGRQGNMRPVTDVGEHMNKM